MRSLADAVRDVAGSTLNDVWLSPLSRDHRFSDGTALGQREFTVGALPPGGVTASELSDLGAGLGTLVVFDGTRLAGVVDGWDVLRTHGQNVDLRGADLRGADLSKSDLRGSNLDGADLSRADLSRTNMMGASANGTLFLGANLHAANLRNLRAVGSSFVRTSLLSVDLRGSRIERCGFLHAETDGLFTEGMEVVDAYDFAY